MTGTRKSGPAHASRLIPALMMKLIMGGLVAMLVHKAGYTETKQRIDDAVIDWSMGMARGLTPLSGRTPEPAYLVIGIGEKTLDDWGRPASTPPDRLRPLIDYAVTGQAAMVLVDVLLDSSVAPQDGGLGLYLAGHGRSNGGRSDGEQVYRDRATPILLARDFRHQGKHGMPEPTGSAMDLAVASNPALGWFSALFPDESGMVRRWRLWEPVCAGDHAAAVPSAQLAAFMRLDGDTMAGNVAALDAAAHGACAPRAAPHPAALTPSVRLVTGNVVSLAADDAPLTRRIFYSVPPILRDGEARPTVTLNARPVPQVVEIEASAISGAFDRSLAKDRIVLIGATAKDKSSLQTPLGAMPGLYVILNSIETLVRFGRLEPLGSAAYAAVEAVLILLSAGLYMRFPLRTAFNLSCGVIAIVFAITITLFQGGLWLDFVLPLLGVLVHGGLERLEARIGHGEST